MDSAPNYLTTIFLFFLDLLFFKKKSFVVFKKKFVQYNEAIHYGHQSISNNFQFEAIKQLPTFETMVTPFSV